MIESLRSPAGRVAIGVAASAMIVALTLLVSASMVALAPLLLLPIWTALFAEDAPQSRPGALKAFLALGLATLIAALVAFFLTR